SRIQALQQALTPGLNEDALPVAAPSEHVIPLAQATSHGERVEIDYKGGRDDRITRRRIDPYGLAKLGPWYVVACCHLREDLRTCREHRIRSIGPTSDTLAPPGELVAYRHMGDATAVVRLQAAVVCRPWLDTDRQSA